MSTFVVYWSQYPEESGESPGDPHLLVEFENREKAIEHLKAEGYIKWDPGRSSDLYLTSFRHIKTFAKVLESKKAEEPKRSKYPPGTITH